jgi:hypothetical protein
MTEKIKMPRGLYDFLTEFDLLERPRLEYVGMHTLLSLAAHDGSTPVIRQGIELFRVETIQSDVEITKLFRRGLETPHSRGSRSWTRRIGGISASAFLVQRSIDCESIFIN